MYPFRSRTRWILANRYRHLLRAFKDHPLPDTLVQERLDSLSRWNRIRDIVSVFVYLGAAASLVTAFGLPFIGGAAAALQQVAAVTGAFAGLFTLVYLLLTRLLGQLEANIWTLLASK